MTQVINLIGGSGLGKSTTAAGLFSEMKLRGLHVELVTEYVKKWAWQGKKIDPLDQPLIFGKQAHAESILYGKVDWIVTDSPLILSALYEEFYNGKSIIKPSVINFLEAAKEKGVVHHNFFMARNKPFDTRGRYETEEIARSVDEFMRGALKALGSPYTVVECADRDRTLTILKSLNLEDARAPAPKSDWKTNGLMGDVGEQWAACRACGVDVPKKPPYCPACLNPEPEAPKPTFKDSTHEDHLKFASEHLTEEERTAVRAAVQVFEDARDKGAKWN
jgi:hypothetical protein